MNFEKLVDTTIVLTATFFGLESKTLAVTLIGVDPGGIWITGGPITAEMTRAGHAVPASKLPAVFVPYHQIVYALTEIERKSPSTVPR
jgi:hypothetical protein